ncbi:NAD(P)-binding domain-containing protein [Streptomyces kronopolitis]|uniref:hypothetical protein n=1 Tax=Streptomyces kronopolitis TaxID=1612435 RepID=UPI0036740601
MKIAILGAGADARGHARHLSARGHQVTLGVPEPEPFMKTDSPDKDGYVYHRAFRTHPKVRLMDCNDAVSFGEVVIKGSEDCGIEVASERGKRAVIDYPLSYYRNPESTLPWPAPSGVTPKLSSGTVDRLEKQLSRSRPGLTIVKVVVTGEQHADSSKGQSGSIGRVFVAGSNEDAKRTIVRLLEAYGWGEVVDVGSLERISVLELRARRNSSLDLGLLFGVSVAK